MSSPSFIFSANSGGRGIHSTKFTAKGLLRMIIYLKQSYYKKKLYTEGFPITTVSPMWTENANEVHFIQSFLLGV